MRFLLLLFLPSLTFAQVSSTDRAVRYSELYTTAPMTLYLSPDGGNSGRCTQTRPCQTINGAMRWVPTNVLHAVRVLPAPGLYPPEWSVIAGFNINNGYIEVEGSWQTATGIDGGTTSGTLTSVSLTYPFFTVTDSTQSWGTDTVKGKWVRFTPDGGVTPVIGNSATTLTLLGAVTGLAPAAGRAYDLIEQAVIFQNDGGTNPTSEVVSIRDIRGGSLISITGGPSLNRVTLNKVAVNVAGAGFWSVGFDSAGPRVEFADVRVQGGIFLTRGPVSALSTSRFFASTNQSQGIQIGHPVYAWTGHTYAMSASQGLSLGSSAKMSFAQNFVFEVTSSTGAPIYLTGGQILSNGSASNTGLVSICPGTSTGSGVRLSTSGQFGLGPNYMMTPALTVRNCGIGIEADNGRSEAYVNQRYEHTADGGTAIAISVARGGKVGITSAPVLSGVRDELRIDGVVVDGGFATLNAATPQVLPNPASPYGSFISR